MDWREFFYIRKSDRSVLIVLLVMAVASLTLVFVVRDPSPEASAPYGDTPWNGQTAGGRGRGQTGSRPPYYQVEGRRYELFPFDPNTADSTQFLRLGLQPWQVRTIYRYRAAGGVYRKPTDFARLYGLTVKQYRQLEPYIRIGEDYRPASEVYGYSRETYRDGREGDHSYPATDVGGAGMASTGADRTASLHYTPKLRPTERVALNTADTTLLMRVPGIGSYYARRIVWYRERLGGDCHIDQLDEIEGFPPDAKHYFSLSDENIRKLNFNTMTLSQLRVHPYMGFYRAKDVIDYRRLRGPIHGWDDLRLLRSFPPDIIKRLAPYVEF